MYCQLDDILLQTALRFADKIALEDKNNQRSYQQLVDDIKLMAQIFASNELTPGSRIAIYLPKQIEAVTSIFAASHAGLVFVPINPLLKPTQVAYILKDCNVKLLITSSQRAAILSTALESCSDLKTIALVDNKPIKSPLKTLDLTYLLAQSKPLNKQVRRIDRDLAAILYTSGSTGQPKGVCISHKNLIAGAQSVASYLNNTHLDKILAVLPLSFDYGLSQITTSFLTGANVVLMEYLLPRDVLRYVDKHQITGLAAVPPLWIQLAQLEWTDSSVNSLRYITNSGGAMPIATLNKLRSALPHTKPYLMYGLTEAFRSTFLEPEQLNHRPESIGKAIPNAEILVLAEDGSECAPNQPGELVHRGVHVSLGYWNSPDKTALRFKPLPETVTNDSNSNAYLSEIAVWSGDKVKKDDEGYLYFIGRQDDMIKCSGYRISPSELEDTIYLIQGVAEVAAIGISDPQLGQAVMLVIKKASPDLGQETIIRYCKAELPNYMQPKYIEFVEQLPRNPNGKVDRKKLAVQFDKT